MRLKYVLGFIGIALVAVLLIQNSEVVTYRVFFWHISISRVILVPMILLIGIILGIILARLRRKR